MTSVTELDLRDLPWWPWPWRLVVYVGISLSVLGAGLYWHPWLTNEPRQSITMTTPLPSFTESLPPTPTTTEVVHTVSELTAANRVALRQFTWQDPSATNQQRTAQVEIWGYYAALQQFTVQLQQRLVNVNITELKLHQRDAILQLSLQLQLTSPRIHTLPTTPESPAAQTMLSGLDPFGPATADLTNTAGTASCHTPPIAVQPDDVPEPIQFLGGWRYPDAAAKAVVATATGQLMTLALGQTYGRQQVLQITDQALVLNEWLQSAPDCWTLRERTIPLAHLNPAAGDVVP